MREVIFFKNIISFKCFYKEDIVLKTWKACTDQAFFKITWVKFYKHAFKRFCFYFIFFYCFFLLQNTQLILEFLLQACFFMQTDGISV